VSGNAPRLALAPLPEELHWDVNAKVAASQEGEVDTFGLVEMADYDTDAEDDSWEDSEAT